jgi:hypothetical protein
LEEAVIIDIIFDESFSQLQDHIEHRVQVMISKIESYKLEKYKESIGQFKPQLDRKIILMMNLILEEFDKGYPSTILVSEIECTLQLILFFSLPMSFHKFD